MLRLCQVIDRINQWAGNVFCYLIIFMMLTGVYEVAMRYFFNRPVMGTYELSELMLAAIVFFGLAYTAVEQGHIRVDLITSILPKKIQAFLDDIATLTGIGIFTLIVI